MSSYITHITNPNTLITKPKVHWRNLVQIFREELGVHMGITLVYNEKDIDNMVIDNNFPDYLKGDALKLLDVLNHKHRLRKWGPGAFNDPYVVKFTMAYTRNWVELFFKPSFMEQYPRGLDSVDEHRLSVLGDQQIAKVACLENSAVYKHLSTDLKRNREVIKYAFKGHYIDWKIVGPNVRMSRFTYTTNPNILALIPGSQQDGINQLYAVLAVRSNPLAFQHVIDKTDDLLKLAISGNAMAFKYGTEVQKRNKAMRSLVFEQSLSQPGNLLMYDWFKSLCSEQEIAAYTAENEKAKKRDMERYHVERAMRG